MIMMMTATFAALVPLITFADVTLSNGIRLRYAQQGPRQGTALILLHGYSDSSFSFSRVMPLLPADLRIIAPDLRGHGDSDRPARGYAVADMADDVLRLMDALEIPAAVVVGHSMGSFVAQAVVERAPGRVSKLVLLASAVKADNAVIDEMKPVVARLTDPVDAEFVRQFQYSTIGEPVPEAFMEKAIETSGRMPSHVWRQVLDGLVSYRASARPAIKTLVLGGVNDTVFSVQEQSLLAAEYPNVKLRLIDNIGHALHWEDPQRFVTELLAFLQ